MTIRAHILDLRERRDAYAGLLTAMQAGRLASDDPEGDKARMQDLASKIDALDLLIATEEARRADRS
jgi:hypothetical protein